MKIIGADVLGKELKKRANLDDIKEAIKLNASELQREAQRQAPVDTGFLKRSISLEIRDNGRTAIVGATAEYAPYVNYGTRFMAAQPFLTSAFNRQEPLFIRDLQRLMK